MGAFEDFVNLELPRRSVLFTEAILGVTGDPNTGIDATLDAAPGGTSWLDSAEPALWDKQTSSPTGWVKRGAGTTSTQVVTSPGTVTAEAGDYFLVLATGVTLDFPDVSTVPTGAIIRILTKEALTLNALGGTIVGLDITDQITRVQPDTSIDFIAVPSLNIWTHNNVTASHLQGYPGTGPGATAGSSPRILGGKGYDNPSGPGGQVDLMEIVAGDGGDGTNTAGHGGQLNISAGGGGNASALTGGNGADLNINAGQGGTGPFSAGSGGRLGLTAGDAGPSTGLTSGGPVELTAGDRSIAASGTSGSITARFEILAGGGADGIFHIAPKIAQTNPAVLALSDDPATEGRRVFVGSVNPDGVVPANPGDQYIRGDGVDSTIYINNGATAGTTWAELGGGGSGTYNRTLATNESTELDSADTVGHTYIEIGKVPSGPPITWRLIAIASVTAGRTVNVTLRNVTLGVDLFTVMSASNVPVKIEQTLTAPQAPAADTIFAVKISLDTSTGPADRAELHYAAVEAAW